MIVRYSESRQMTTRSRTVDGFLFNIFLHSKNVNTPIIASDFNPRQVSIKVILRRGGRNFTICQDNMLILGTFCSMTRGHHEFQIGFNKHYQSPTVKATNLRYFFLDFGSPLNLKGDDELYTEVTLSNSAFGATIDETLSYVEFSPNYAMAYEVGIPFLMSNVVQANATKENFNPGDNILTIAYLNFDKTDWVNPVVNNLQLSSDRLDLSLNFHEIMCRNLLHFEHTVNYRTGSTLPIDEITGTGKVYKWFPPFAQSFIIFNGGQSSREIDQCSLDLSFDGEQVQASQNYIVCRRLETDISTIVRAQDREVKHINEKLASLPAAMT